MRISATQGTITTGGGGGLPPQAMWPGYQDTQSVAFQVWGPTSQTAFNVGAPDYYHVYELVGGVWTLSPGQANNPALTNPGVTANNSGSNPHISYVRRNLNPGTATQFAVRSVLGGLESVNGPVLTMSTLANGPSVPPTPPADTSWEVGVQLAGTPVVCNSQASFLAALAAANPAGPNVIALDPTGSFPTANFNGYYIQPGTQGGSGIFTGTGGWTTIISTEAPEYKAFISSTGGKLPAFNANAGPPVWIMQTCSGANIAANATNAMLLAPWAKKSGWYYVWFQEGTGTSAVIEERWVVFTQNSATIDWSANNGNYPNAGLTAAAQVTIWVFYEPSVTPWDAFTNVAMPTIDMGAIVNSFGIQIPAGTTKVRFIGINIKTTGLGAAASTTQATGYIKFANSPEPSQGAPLTPAESVYFDRCMAGNDTGSATYQFCGHGIGWINCNHLLVSQCYFYGVATNQIASGGDSNNFTFNGRNQLWRSTYLSAVSECHIIGGGYEDNVNPVSDVHFLNLSTHKPLGWLPGVSVAVASWTPGPGSVGATGGVLATAWPFPSGTCTVALSAETNTATFTNGQTAFTFGTALTQTDTFVMNPQGTSGGNTGGLVPYWLFGREVKNHLEQKGGSRVSYNGIVCRNNWVGKQAGYHGTAFAPNSRDQQMSANAAVNFTDLCTYFNTQDVDIQNCITLNCPAALVTFTSDFSTGAFVARLRYKNNLSWISTNSVGERMTAIWLIGPCSDVIIDQSTFITNQQVDQSQGTPEGVHFSWFNPVAGSNANMTPFSPFAYTPYQDRLTITNSIVDSGPSVGIANPAFFQDAVIPINFSTYPNITFNKNVTINDTSGGYPSMAASNIAYANVGFQNYQGNNLPPQNPSDWAVTQPGTAGLNAASTVGGPVGYAPGAPLFLGNSFQGISTSITSSDSQDTFFQFTGTDGKYGNVLPRAAAGAFLFGGTGGNDLVQQTCISKLASGYSADIVESIATDNTVPPGVSSTVRVSTLTNPFDQTVHTQNSYLINPGSGTPGMVYVSHWIWLQADMTSRTNNANHFGEFVEFKTGPGNTDVERFQIGYEITANPNNNWTGFGNTPVFIMLHDQAGSAVPNQELLYFQIVISPSATQSTWGQFQTHAAPIPLGRWFRLEWAFNRSDSSGQGWMWAALTDPGSTDPALQAGIQFWAARGAFNASGQTLGCNQALANAIDRIFIDNTPYTDISRSSSSTYVVKTTDYQVYAGWPSNASAHPANYL